MKKVLITGASGFIGSFLVEEALKNGYEVYAGIRKSSSRKYLQDKHIQFVFLSLYDKEKLVEELKIHADKYGKFDYVIHNAGATKAKNKEAFMNINFRFTQNLIESLTQSGYNLKKFVFMSSLAAYGPGNPKTMLPIKESDPMMPITAYGESKKLTEQYLQTLKEFPWISIRPTGVYGPRDKDYFILIKTMKGGLEPYIGTTKQQISFIYVKDLCRIIFQAMNSEIIHKGYFIADGNSYHTDAYGTFVKKELNLKPVKVVFPLFIAKLIAVVSELIAKISGRPSTINREKIGEISCLNWQAEIDELKKDFNFVPEFDLEKGVRDSILWYKENGWI